MAFPSFFKPNTPATEAPKAPETTEISAASEGNSTPPPDPQAIPEKADLNFFNNLVKDAPAHATPESPLSVGQDILNPDNMKKIVDAQDFSAYIPKETLQKLQEGDQGAMMEAVQAMSKAAYSTALSQTGTILDTVLSQRESVVRDQVRSEILNSLAAKEVTNAIPGIEHPAVKGMASMISANLSQQFPKASPDQIRGMTQQYFAEVNNAMNPPATPVESKAKASEVDWMAYAGFNPSPS